MPEDTPPQKRGAPKKESSMMSRISFRAPQEMVDWLALEAQKHHLCVGGVARMYLAEKKRKGDADNG